MELQDGIYISQMKTTLFQNGKAMKRIFINGN